jgi:hypothetical protein
MNTKMIVYLVAATLLSAASFAKAQQPTKVPRIGYLSSSDPDTESTRAEAIGLALPELGYIWVYIVGYI